MQIEIDFDVFKALTALREHEGDTYNAVIRRLLKLPTQNALTGAINAFSPERDKDLKPPNALTNATSALSAYPNVLMALGGAWFDNIHFPEGTQFRATYKGQTFFAEIKDGCWVGSDGLVRTSPSAAASAISKTNVNGWRFWHAKRPGDPGWSRIDEFKS